MKRRALFVGVENYDDDGIQNLRYAIDDAAVMSSAFRRLGFETTCLRDCSQPEVLDAIADSTRNLHAGDLFLFFFSGHGFSVGSEDLVFCPEDRCNDLRSGAGAGMSYAKLKARTEKANDQFDRVFLFDTCRSYLAGVKGAASSESIVLDDGRCVGTRDLNPVSGFTRNMSGSVYVLRSCSSGQLSLELPDEASGGRNGNGLFTKALLSVLKRSFEGNQPVSLNDVFYKSLKADMERIKADHHRTWIQTPEFAYAGETLCLWIPEGAALPPSTPPSPPPPPSIPLPTPPSSRQSDVEHILDESIRHIQFLCGSATVDLTQNRADVEVREKLGEVFKVFYELDRNRDPEGRLDNPYDKAEIERMEDACENLVQFLQMRHRANCPVWLARECKASVKKDAELLLGVRRFDKLAELMLKCVRDSATGHRRLT